MTYLMLGASLREAVRPYLRDAIKAAVNPSVATMATMGIVSLPGMMTGQILGGAMPTTAIKYQIGIMICIFTAMVVAALVNILLSLPVAFDDHQRLKEDIFAAEYSADRLEARRIFFTPGLRQQDRRLRWWSSPSDRRQGF
jgi:putative ABC transport system permease protein